MKLKLKLEPEAIVVLVLVCLVELVHVFCRYMTDRQTDVLYFGLSCISFWIEVSCVCVFVFRLFLFLFLYT